MNAEIITIGDEILAGDILNTNAHWLAKQLNGRGVRVERIAAIGDDIDKIALEIKSSKADWIIVTGGLGPTHDDVTREGIAKALEKKLVRNEKAVEMIRQKDTNRLQLVMADLPEDAIPVENPCGLAPGFISGNIIVLPGVPRELEAMFPLVVQRFKSTGLFVEWVQTAKKEVEILELLNDAVKQFKRVKIGSYPSKGSVKIKLTSGNKNAVKAARIWLEKRIK